MSDFKSKLKNVVKKEKGLEVNKKIKIYRSLTLIRPDNSSYWYQLAILYFSIGKNRLGFEAAANSKKLGNAKASVLIEKIIKQYAEDSQSVQAKLALQRIRGEVV